MDSMYSNQEDGLCGNDDAGQMSAWYVFSSMGFYPVLPGSDEYAIGSPLIKKAILQLSNGNKLHINAINQSSSNIYVSKIEINGKEHNSNILKHSDIVCGVEITFYMSDTPADK